MDTKPYEFYSLGKIYKVSDFDVLPNDNDCWYLVCCNYNNFANAIQLIRHIPIPMYILERLPGCMIGKRPDDPNKKDSEDGWLFWAHDDTSGRYLFSKIAIRLIPVKGKLIFIPDGIEAIEHKEYNLSAIANNLISYNVSASTERVVEETTLACPVDKTVLDALSMKKGFLEYIRDKRVEEMF